MRYYISGRVTGNKNADAEFARAERWLNSKDEQVINPHKVLAPIGKTLTYEECMQLCFKMIELCDCIYMLIGWQRSRGACAELAYAKALGKQVRYEDKQRTFKQIASKDEHLAGFIAYCEACGEQTEMAEVKAV